MFGFLRSSGSKAPSSSVRRALEKDGLPPSIERASMLQMVESRGRFSDRKVTYIRVFDPALVAARGLSIRAFKDLDPHPDVVLRSGHIESDGSVFLTRAARVQAPAPTVRSVADRSGHADDEHLVFYDRDRSTQGELA